MYTGLTVFFAERVQTTLDINEFVIYKPFGNECVPYNEGCQPEYHFFLRKLISRRNTIFSLNEELKTYM